MPMLTDIEDTIYQHVLSYGPPKTGKSLLAGETASDFNLVWFDLENGSGVLKQLPLESRQKILVIKLPDTRSYPIAIETMLKVIKGGKFEICVKHGKVACQLCKKDTLPFDTLDTNTFGSNTIMVIDSLTQLTNSAISNITKGQPDDYKLQYDDWGNLGKLMDIFLSHVQQAPFHVLCISHEVEAEREDGTNKIVPVAGTRNFSRNVAKYFDHVIYQDVRNKKHVVGSSTTYMPSIQTGSRSGIAMETEDKPSLVPLFKGQAAKIGVDAGQVATTALKQVKVGLGLGVKKS